jgi:hypothetical protein
MTDGRHEGGGVEWGAPPTGSPDPSAAGKPTPGWYRDPWASGQHRYWNGESWTGDAFPHGLAGPSAPDYLSFAEEPRTVTTGPPPPPPEWSAPPGATRPANPPTTPIPPVPTDERPRVPRHQLVAILLLVPLIVGLSSFAGFYFANRGHSKPVAQSTTPTSPPPTTTPGSTPGPALAPGLSGLGLTQNDVGSAVTVQQLQNGDQVSGQPTLDVCNGRFPSESLRTARLQVVGVDSQGNTVLSTETVSYSSAAATAQAFSELAATATNCPATPVTSPVGEPTITTHFNAPPDGSWPQVATVQRLAFDFSTTDQSGQAQHNVAVYLRRGRVLLGIYFDQPDGAQPSVAGQTTIPGIVNVFATRMAQLPDSTVNG